MQSAVNLVSQHGIGMRLRSANDPIRYAVRSLVVHFPYTDFDKRGAKSLLLLAFSSVQQALCSVDVVGCNLIKFQ